jgi:hypothetical protein
MRVTRSAAQSGKRQWRAVAWSSKGGAERQGGVCSPVERPLDETPLPPSMSIEDPLESAVELMVDTGHGEYLRWDILKLSQRRSRACHSAVGKYSPIFISLLGGGGGGETGCLPTKLPWLLGMLRTGIARRYDVVHSW